MAEHRNVAVIGAGVAGLSAARAAAQAGASVVCFDRMGPGGVLINLGPLHDAPAEAEGLNGPDFVAKLYEEAAAAGVELAFAEVTGLTPGQPWQITTTDESWTADRIVLATGLAAGKLGLDNEAEFEGRGISHCANCDGPLYAGQAVMVTGDHRWAVQEAAELAASAAEVTLLTAGTQDPHGAEALAGLTNVTIRHGRITALEGSDGLQSVSLDEAGTVRTLPLRGLFVYSGERAATDLIAGLTELAAAGQVAIDAEGRTPIAGLFAAGDLCQGSERTILSALGDGARAGAAAARPA